MRIKLARKFLIPIIIAALLATIVPAVSAFESHLINVRVRVEERFNCFKTIELASPEDVQDLIDAGLIPAIDPNQPDVDPNQPNEVPTFTCVVWLLKLTFCNFEDNDIGNVTIRDNFSGEITGQPVLEDVPVDVLIRGQTQGKSHKKELQQGTTIFWYVTCEDWDPGTGECVDNSGIMEPGECAYLYMLVWTKTNPGGQQLYAESGDYTLNSGPNAKWLDPEGHQGSFAGESVHIHAFD
jgi:hypothetical protein